MPSAWRLLLTIYAGDQLLHHRARRFISAMSIIVQAKGNELSAIGASLRNQEEIGCPLAPLGSISTSPQISAPGDPPPHDGPPFAHPLSDQESETVALSLHTQVTLARARRRLCSCVIMGLRSCSMRGEGWTGPRWGSRKMFQTNEWM